MYPPQDDESKNTLKRVEQMEFKKLSLSGKKRKLIRPNHCRNSKEHNSSSAKKNYPASSSSNIQGHNSSSAKENDPALSSSNIQVLIKKCMDEKEEIKVRFLKYEESLLKLFAEIRKHHPSLSHLLPPDKGTQCHTRFNHLKEAENTVWRQPNPIMKMEVVCNMMTQKNKFDELSSTYKELSEKVSSSAKKAFLKQLVTAEKAYEKHLQTYEENMTNTLKFGINHLNTSIQDSLRLDYNRWFNTLSKGLQEIKAKRKQLSAEWKDKSTAEEGKDSLVLSGVAVLDPMSPLQQLPLTNKVNKRSCNEDDKECQTQESNDKTQNKDNKGVDKQDSLVLSGVTVLDPMSPLQELPLTNKVNKRSCNEDDKECQTQESNDKTQNKDNKGVDKQFWPGKSLPVFEDLFSEDRFVGVNLFASNSKPSTNITSVFDHDYQPKFPKSIAKQGAEKDNFIVDSIITGMGAELGTTDLENDVNNSFGGHFLEPEMTLITESQDGFLFNVAKVAQEKQPEVLTSTPIPKSSQVLDTFSFITCSICHEVFQYKALLSPHLTLVHSAKHCHLCDFIASDLHKLKSHVDEHHKSFKVCMQCAKIQDQVNFSSHEASHQTKTLEGHYDTIVAPKTFNNMETFNAPEKQYYRCYNCENVSISRYEMHNHYSAHHLSEVYKQLLCEVCHLPFVSDAHLLKHLKQTHQIKKNTFSTNIPCPVCARTFDDESKFIHHLKNDHTSNCLVIKAGTDDRTSVMNHKCKYCEMYLKNTKVRDIHTIIFHETPPYICNCKCKFFTKAMLDFHRVKHTKAEEARFQLKSSKWGQEGCLLPL